MYIPWLRNPKTTQERRAAQDERIKVRAKRNKTNLPNAWDDIFVDGIGKKNKSWKKIRKTKYKPK